MFTQGAGSPGPGSVATDFFNQSQFKIDENTGAAQLTYPISVPPGRNGMRPDVDLSYNSQNGQLGSIVGNSDGWHASASLQATTGVVFGSTSTGGTLNPVCSSQGCGTLFGQSTGLAPFVSLVRNPARVGQMIGILGQGLTGTTNVSINGTAAAFRVVSSTLLEAAVPSGAKTGYIMVTTPQRVLTSNVLLRVIQ